MCVGWKLLQCGLVGWGEVGSDVRIVCNPETRATEVVVGYVTMMATNCPLHEMVPWSSMMMQRGEVLSAGARCR